MMIRTSVCVSDCGSDVFLNCEGSGLYVMQSAANHSCRPNAEISFPHNNFVLRFTATRDIAAGEVDLSAPSTASFTRLLTDTDGSVIGSLYFLSGRMHAQQKSPLPTEVSHVSSWLDGGWGEWYGSQSTRANVPRQYLAIVTVDQSGAARPRRVPAGGLQCSGQLHMSG